MTFPALFPLVTPLVVDTTGDTVANRRAITHRLTRVKGIVRLIVVAALRREETVNMAVTMLLTIVPGGRVLLIGTPLTATSRQALLMMRLAGRLFRTVLTIVLEMTGRHRDLRKLNRLTVMTNIYIKIRTTRSVSKFTTNIFP